MLQIDQLVGAFYDAALEPRFWERALELLCRRFNGTSALLGLADPRGVASSLSLDVLYDMDHCYAEQYNDYYYQLNDSLNKHLMRGGGVAGSTLFVPEEISEDDECEGTELDVDWVRPQGWVYNPAVGFLSVDENLIGILTLTFDRQSRLDDPVEKETFRRLVPHMQRAVDQHKRFSGLADAHGALMEALDRVFSAVLLVDAGGRVVRMNRAAEEIFADVDGLALDRHGRIETPHAKVGRKIQRTIKGASRTLSAGWDIHDPAGAGGVRTVERPSGKRAYQLTISPMTVRQSAHNGEPLGAIVFITDPEREHPLDFSGHLEQIYGLTGAEARVAVHLSRGQSLDHIADELQVTKNTVRTLLQRVFSKTDTRRQAELVSLLLRSRSSASSVVR